MFNLLENLNQIVNESIERRSPVLKASIIDADGKHASAIDLQHLPKNNVIIYGTRLVSQILSQFKNIDSINFKIEADGMFNKLYIMIKNNKSKLLNIEINQLSENEVNELKKIIYVNFMRRKA